MKFSVICLYLNELFTMLGDLTNVHNNYNFPMNYLIVIFNPKLFVGGFMSYLRYLCLFAYCGVQHILCCIFVLFYFVLCLVYPMLPVSLDCPFLIAPSVFSNVYLETSCDTRKCKCLFLY